jgi:hypothetical protein
MNIATTVLKLTVLVPYALTDKKLLHCWSGGGKGAKKDSIVIDFQEM